MGTGIATRWPVAGLVLGLLTGCAVPPPSGGPAPPPVPAETGEHAPPPAPGERKVVMPAAVRGLVARAEDSSAAGEHDRAVAYLERALRIVPRNAIIWQNLAVVRYRQGQYAQAESLALKSIALAGDDVELKRQDWVLIGAARQLQGDEVGARQARTRAAKLANPSATP
ncbi:MAG: tetratricopeptide repeat protein [Nitrococcus mobilis]|nr:tetratricopeptide repeat protein [Nitrococcus mobilis]